MYSSGQPFRNKRFGDIDNSRDHGANINKVDAAQLHRKTVLPHSDAASPQPLTANDVGSPLLLVPEPDGS